MSPRPRHEYATGFPRGLLGSSRTPPQEFPVVDHNGCAPFPAQIHQVRAGVAFRDVKRRFLAYSSPFRSPDPPHLAVLERPGFVRAAPTRTGTTRAQAALSSTRPTATGPAAKVSHLHSNHSASRRKRDRRQIRITRLFTTLPPDGARPSRHTVPRPPRSGATSSRPGGASGNAKTTRPRLGGGCGCSMRSPGSSVGQD